MIYRCFAQNKMHLGLETLLRFCTAMVELSPINEGRKLCDDGLHVCYHPELVPSYR